MAELVYPAPLRALDANGDPVGAAEAFFFRTDTTTPLTVYADAAGSSAHPVPLVADANGVFDPVFNTSAFGAKVDIRDPSTDASLPGYPINLAVATSTTTGAASLISFAPTEEIEETDVQSAIESVDTDWRAADADQQAVLDTFGNAATLTVGTSAFNAIQLDSLARIPAVSGVNLTNFGLIAATGGTTTALTTSDSVRLTASFTATGTRMFAQATLTITEPSTLKVDYIASLVLVNVTTATTVATGVPHAYTHDTGGFSSFAAALSPSLAVGGLTVGNSYEVRLQVRKSSANGTSSPANMYITGVIT